LTGYAAPGGAVACEPRSGSKDADLPEKAFTFRVPTKLASLGSLAGPALRQAGACRRRGRRWLSQVEQARHSAWKLNFRVNRNPLSWNRGPRAEACGPAFLWIPRCGKHDPPKRSAHRRRIEDGGRYLARPEARPKATLCGPKAAEKPSEEGACRRPGTALRRARLGDPKMVEEVTGSGGGEPADPEGPTRSRSPAGDGNLVLCIDPGVGRLESRHPRGKPEATLNVNAGDYWDVVVGAAGSEELAWVGPKSVSHAGGEPLAEQRPEPASRRTPGQAGRSGRPMPLSGTDTRRARSAQFSARIESERPLRWDSEESEPSQLSPWPKPAATPEGATSWQVEWACPKTREEFSPPEGDRRTSLLTQTDESAAGRRFLPTLAGRYLVRLPAECGTRRGTYP